MQEMNTTEATKYKGPVELIILGYYNNTGSVGIRRYFALCVLFLSSDESCINTNCVTRIYSLISRTNCIKPMSCMH